MVASSVVLTVVVLNYHHRTPTTHSMSNWVSQEPTYSWSEGRKTSPRHIVEPVPPWVRKGVRGFVGWSWTFRAYRLSTLLCILMKRPLDELVKQWIRFYLVLISSNANFSSICIHICWLIFWILLPSPGSFIALVMPTLFILPPLLLNSKMHLYPNSSSCYSWLLNIIMVEVD